MGGAYGGGSGGGRGRGGRPVKLGWEERKAATVRIMPEVDRVEVSWII